MINLQTLLSNLTAASDAADAGGATGVGDAGAFGPSFGLDIFLSGPGGAGPLPAPKPLDATGLLQRPEVIDIVFGAADSIIDAVERQRPIPDGFGLALTDLLFELFARIIREDDDGIEGQIGDLQKMVDGEMEGSVDVETKKLDLMLTKRNQKADTLSAAIDKFTDFTNNVIRDMKQ